MQANEKERFYNTIGDKIRNARLSANLTQEAFASFLKLSRASIVNIEKGRQHPPVHLLWDMARILNTSLPELLPNLNPREEVDINDKWQKITIKEAEGNEKLLDFIVKAQKPSK